MSTALVTGGSRGFGRAAAERLASEGWKVVIDGRDERTLRSVASGLGDGVTAIVGDVADPSHRRALAEAIDDHHGLDLLLNNASSLGPSPLPELSRYPLDVLAEVFQVNTVAPLALMQLLLPNVRLADGVVVNVTSDAAVEAYPTWGGYGASKAALEAIGSVFAVENQDVRIYTFDPGDMRTDMHQAAYPWEDISDRAEPESVVPALLTLMAERPPSGRYRAADLLADVGAAR